MSRKTRGPFWRTGGDSISAAADKELCIACVTKRFLASRERSLTLAHDRRARGAHFAASRRGGGADHRSAAKSSAVLASTQAVPAIVCTCFQNGARVFR